MIISRKSSFEKNFLRHQYIDRALNSSFRDFEDAVQYYSALEVKSQYFITRNKRDYPSNHMRILTPDDFLTLLKEKGAPELH